MPILSRRIVAALAAFFGLLAVLGFAVPGHAAGDNTNLVQALRAGGFVIVVRHGATFPDQADTDPLNFDNIAAQRNLNDKGKALARLSATPFFRPGFRSARSLPASTTEPTRPRSLRASRISRRLQILPRAVSWCRRTRTTAASTLFASCSAPRRRLAPTRFSLRTSRTSSMRSARTGSTSKRARPRSSAPRTAATSSSPECRWKNGLTSQRREVRPVSVVSRRTTPRQCAAIRQRPENLRPLRFFGRAAATGNIRGDDPQDDVSNRRTRSLHR